MLWLVRAWKVGDLERKAAALHADPKNISPPAGELSSEPAPVPTEVKMTPFVKRLVMWTKV